MTAIREELKSLLDAMDLRPEQVRILQVVVEWVAEQAGKEAYRLGQWETRERVAEERLDEEGEFCIVYDTDIPVPEKLYRETVGEWQEVKWFESEREAKEFGLQARLTGFMVLQKCGEYALPTKEEERDND